MSRLVRYFFPKKLMAFPPFPAYQLGHIHTKYVYTYDHNSKMYIHMIIIVKRKIFSDQLSAL